MNLKGKLVINTRPTAQIAELSELLQAAGAEVLELPMLQIVDTVTAEQLLHALKSFSAHDWIVFTSSNGVRVVDAAVSSASELAKFFKEGCSIAVVGQKTARACENVGWPVRFVSSKADAVTLGNELAVKLSVLLPAPKVAILRAKDGNPELVTRLKAADLEVVGVPVYYSEMPSIDIALRSELRRKLSKNKNAVVAITSGLAAENWKQLLLAEKLALDCCKVAVIGPETKKKVLELGMSVEIVAAEASMKGLTVAIGNYYCGA